MVVLIDTNVALDFLTVRQPFYQSAKAILQACASDDMQGYRSEERRVGKEC